MSAFWFVVGLLCGVFLAAAVLKFAVRVWWHWVGIIVFLAWFVFGTAVAAATFAEGYPQGGFILLVGTLVIALAIGAGLRALLRAGGARPVTTARSRA